MSADVPTGPIPVQVAEIRQDVRYIRRDLDRKIADDREDKVETKQWRREVIDRLDLLEDRVIGQVAVKSSAETVRTRITFAGVLLFGLSGMVVGILSVVIR